MTDNLILHERDGEFTRITINRADVGGLMSDAMAAELTGMIDKAATESKAILVASAGDDFCLGRDPAGRPGSPPKDPMEHRERSEVVFNFYGAFRRAPVPVVGLVQGRALGFGCAMAALFDITIAAEGARFALPEMGHNIMPTMAMSSMVDRVGYKGLVYLTYSTAEIDAKTALAFGLVSQVVPDGELVSAGDTLLGALAKAPLPALRAVKEFARAANGIDIAKVTDFAKNMHAAVNMSAAMKG